MIDTVLFDLDGTLLNTIGDLQASVNAVLRAHNFPRRSEDEVRRFIGNGIPTFVRRCLPATTSEACFQNVLEEFYSHYRAHMADHTVPFDGIPTLLQSLTAASYKVAVVSNKNQAEVTALCDHFFPHQIEASIGTSPTVARKPATVMIDLALDTLASRRQTTLYVGDSEVDVATAANAGLTLLSATWGYRSADYLREKGAQRLITQPRDVWRYLQQVNRIV